MDNFNQGFSDPDCALVEETLRGNVEAFGQLIDRHSRRVHRTLTGILNDHEDARDVMQDTFLKAFQYLYSFERRSKFSTWLISIASKTALQRLRERKPMESLDEYEDTDGQSRARQIRALTHSPEDLYSQAQVRAVVEKAVNRLPAKYRTVVILRYIEQRSTEDAAALLGLGIPALKARLLRGKLLLREGLSQHLLRNAGAMAR